MTDTVVATLPGSEVTADPGAMTRAQPPVGSTGAWRVVGACVVLLLSYVVLSFANDPRGTIVSDSGGKLATLSVMQDRGTFVPDVGYWAERFDPSGSLHPLGLTRRVGDHWVQVSTLPMLELAVPLYDFGGTRAALLLPMMGAVLAALAARALARRLGPGQGWVAFWAIGLLTPVAIYALDFWEHSLGIGLMMWGAVLLLDVLDRRAGWRGAVAAGALFGVAATMRTEALVYLLITAAVVCVVTTVRGAFARAVSVGSAIVVGAALPLILNSGLERLLLGADLRTARATTTATGTGASGATRVREALTSTVGIGFGNLRPGDDWFLGAITALLVGGAALALVAPNRRLRLVGVLADVAALVIYLGRFETGLGFVPGLLVASPLAAAGLALCWRERGTRITGVIALLALPVVWASQYTGTMWPQWGGRYVLVSGVLLAVAACVVLRRSPRALLATCLVAGVVTAGGIVWLSVRTHTNVDGMRTILARHDELLIARHDQLLREVGAFYTPQRHWLTAASDAQLDRAVEIARESGAREFATVGPEGQSIPRHLDGYTRGHTQLVPFTRPDVRVQVTTYRLDE